MFYLDRSEPEVQALVSHEENLTGKVVDWEDFSLVPVRLGQADETGVRGVLHVVLGQSLVLHHLGHLGRVARHHLLHLALAVHQGAAEPQQDAAQFEHEPLRTTLCLLFER